MGHGDGYGDRRIGNMVQGTGRGTEGWDRGMGTGTVGLRWTDGDRRDWEQWKAVRKGWDKREMGRQEGHGMEGWWGQGQRYRGDGGAGEGEGLETRGGWRGRDRSRMELEQRSNGGAGGLRVRGPFGVSMGRSHQCHLPGTGAWGHKGAACAALYSQSRLCPLPG